MPVDTSTPPTVLVTGTVHAPLEEVWALFRSFGQPIMDWWPIYTSVELEDGGADEVGVVRHLKTTSGRAYREKLVARDDATATLTYDMLTVEPAVPTFTGATTTVVMTDGGGGTTHVLWRSWSEASRLLLGQIKATQTAVYEAAIVSLNRHFHPALGTLEVTVVAAKGLDNGRWFPTNPFVVVELDDGPVQMTHARHLTSHPVFGDALTFDVLSEAGELRLTVFDERIGEEGYLGGATLDLHGIASGERTHHTVELAGSSGPTGGTVTVELVLSLEGGEQLPETETSRSLHHLAVLQGVFDKLQKQAMQLIQQAGNGPSDTWAYGRYDRVPTMPDVPMENLPRPVVGLPPEAALAPEKLGRMVERGIEYLYSQAGFLTRAGVVDDPYLAYFGGWIEPNERLVAHWQDDAELARQFTQGVGPMVIARVTSLTDVPSVFHDLTPDGRSLADLIADKSLFLLDYAPLAPLKPYANMVFYAPYVLVHKETGPDGHPRLTLSAIQLEREGGDVYTPGNTPPNRWALAKMHVACADNQMHQWLFHLGFAHLAMEPFIIAWHNALPDDHPVHQLLAPHFQDTVGINFLARQTLVSEVAPFTDKTFSTGTAQALQMFLGAWEDYDFLERSFPGELAKRGFDEAGTDGLADYTYRDDGFLVWNALGRYVQGVVESCWADDAAVAADEHLAAWATECSHADKAAVPGFPKAFSTRAALVQALQTLVWNVSAAHSAVNFSQFDYLSYVPNRPDSLFAAMPAGHDEIDAQVLEDALPNPLISHFQISFAWILTLPTAHPLTGVDAMAERCPEAHERFQADLAEVTAKILARNEALEKRGLPPYPYLLPDNIASSIAI